MGRVNKGFSAVEAIIILAVVAALGVGAYFVFARQKNNNSQSGKTAESSQTQQANVQWSFTGTEWRASAEPPACSNPLLKSPVDVSVATSILYPGQTRGGQYKPHGGFRFDRNADNSVAVRAPMNAELVKGSRYIEGGEVQYLFEFVNSCGIKYRFDHLLTLSPQLQTIADTLPPAKPDDSRTTNLSGTTVKAGDLLATEVGFAKTTNVAVDFGVYDLRQPNQISKNASWAAAHPNKEADSYGVCWLDLLPEPDKTTVKKLPAGDQASGSKSDYCD